jgi:Ca2+-binding EF-hand superfamily protein
MLYTEPFNLSGLAPGNYTIDYRCTDNADNTQTDSIQVKLKMMTDVNNDGIIDIADLYTAASAFGSDPNHPRWNPCADVNGDGLVDIMDIFSVARNFGKEY